MSADGLDWVPPATDTRRANVVRVCDYLLGGSHNFLADQDVARAQHPVPEPGPHSRVLLASDQDAAIIQAGLREPEKILAHDQTRRLIDFSQPARVTSPTPTTRGGSWRRCVTRSRPEATWSAAGLTRRRARGPGQVLVSGRGSPETLGASATDSLV